MLRSELKGRRRYLAFGLVASVGVACAALIDLGNPGNMGICGACFLRDTAGSLGLFSGLGPRIYRPEVFGVALGALLLVLARGRFTARSGSHATTRLFFGAWMGIGSLVFLGCPFRLLQRLGGGDLNALAGLLGFVLGVGIGLAFERRGYQLGKTSEVPITVGMLGPLAMLLMFLLFLRGGLLLGPGPDSSLGPPHAPYGQALVIAVFVGVALSATRFCAVTAARQVFLRQSTMLWAALVLIAGYAITSALTGRFDLAIANQPTAHSDHVWSGLGMVLVGLCGCLVGGCPVRQLVMAGEGNGDAFVTVAGLAGGAGLAHGLGLAASGEGTTPAGQWAVSLGLLLALAYASSIARRAARE